MIDLFGEEEPASSPKKKPRSNPLIRAYGVGPEGTKCGSCTFHYFKIYASKYPKCEKRPDGGAATDHSSRFPSCGLYQVKPTGSFKLRFQCRVCGKKSLAVDRDRVITDEQLRKRGFFVDTEEPGVWVQWEEACSWQCRDTVFKQRKKKR